MQILDNFKDYMEYEARFSKQTVYAYTCRLNAFISFLGKTPEDATNNDIRDFIKYLRNNGLKDSSISSFIFSVRCLYKYISHYDRREQILSLKYFLENVIRTKSEKPMPVVPTSGEIEALRKTLKAYKEAFAFNQESDMYTKTVRDIAIFELLISTGLRSAELRGLCKSDVDLENRALLIRCGKGGKQRVSIFGDMAYDALKHHLEHNNFASNDIIFKMNPTNMLNQIIHRWTKRAHINGAIHAHSFRHYHITQAQKNGIPLSAVADQVGHSCLETTKHYTHLDVDYRRELYKNNPI